VQLHVSTEQEGVQPAATERRSISTSKGAEQAARCAGR